MEKLIENKSFHLCVICVCLFMSSGSVTELWDGIRHGLDAVLTAKGI